mgnify:CR=1 FL=1
MMAYFTRDREFFWRRRLFFAIWSTVYAFIHVTAEPHKPGVRQ